MTFNMTHTKFLAVAFAWTCGATATPFTGSVELDTSLLVDPFEIAFVLTDGSGSDDGNTAVTFDDFAFGGGSGGAVDTAFTTGDAGGDLGSGFTLRDSTFIGIIASTFTPGIALSFDFRVDSTPEAGGTPDFLALVLLGIDGTPIATTDPSGADALMTIETGVTQTPIVRTFTGELTPAPIVVTSTVAEPGTLSILLFAFAALARARKRSSKETR